MPNVLLNGKPNQEFPDESDFDVLMYQLARATDRLKDRSETMEIKYRIMQTRVAAAEAAVKHLLNRVAVLLIDNQELRDRLTELERVMPPDDIRRKFDILHQKVFQLEYEVHASRPWYIRVLEFFARKPEKDDDIRGRYDIQPTPGDAGSSDFLDLE